MQVWFYEEQSRHLRLGLRVRQVVHHEKSPYQEVLVVDTDQWGRMLALDNIIQTNEVTEFVYHEMMAHVALFAHPNPERVLVVGGGDGGVIREVVKHPTVSEAVLAEIDEAVIEAARRFLPSISSGLDDPRTRIAVGDGIAHVAESPGTYDVIIVDSTDPIGPAVGLFSEEFYRSAHRALRDGGLLVAQTESPFYNADLIRRVQRALRNVFPWSGLYWCVVPEYPGGCWTISIASRGGDPRPVPAGRYAERRFETFGTRYYTPQVHGAAFTLPALVLELLPEDAPQRGGASWGGLPAPQDPTPEDGSR
ncbi:MAG TPA: polyamine aminopropyltransferase [Bacillota bacterium]